MRCDADLRALERLGRAHLPGMKAYKMTRFLFVISLVLIASSASAQQQGHDACARDVSRFCRAHMNEGDQVVLSDMSQWNDVDRVHIQ